MTEVLITLIGLATVYVAAKIIAWLIKMTLILAVVTSIGFAIYIHLPTEIPKIPNRASVDVLVESLKN